MKQLNKAKALQVVKAYEKYSNLVRGYKAHPEFNKYLKVISYKLDDIGCEFKNIVYENTNTGYIHNLETTCISLKHTMVK